MTRRASPHRQQLVPYHFEARNSDKRCAYARYLHLQRAVARNVHA